MFPSAATTVQCPQYQHPQADGPNLPLILYK